jgi:hypothetical protein
MVRDDNVFLFEILCETCGRTFYYDAEALTLAQIRVRFGVHEFCCRWRSRNASGKKENDGVAYALKHD